MVIVVWDKLEIVHELRMGGAWSISESKENGHFYIDEPKSKTWLLLTQYGRKYFN